VEIVTYVRSGVLTHQDSLGNQGRTGPGEVQVMSAGSGLRHAEYNLENSPASIFQIWIEPDYAGTPPFWAARHTDRTAPEEEWVCLASGAGVRGALPLRADAAVYGATLSAGSPLSFPIPAGRHVYLAVSAGRMRIDGVALGPGDGAAIIDETAVRLEGLNARSHVVLVETS
jgi:hypothetical protein